MFFLPAFFDGDLSAWSVYSNLEKEHSFTVNTLNRPCQHK